LAQRRMALLLPVKTLVMSGLSPVRTMLVTAEVAVYTEHWHHVGVMRRVLLRMSSWMNYVFLEH
jgi:hypothetical protein